ncbi:MAG: hypothetical protein GY765_17510 [bacterium]|nr:hypothetical protein [bacterium]
MTFKELILGSANFVLAIFTVLSMASFETENFLMGLTGLLLVNVGLLKDHLMPRKTTAVPVMAGGKKF